MFCSAQKEPQQHALAPTLIAVTHKAVEASCKSFALDSAAFSLTAVTVVRSEFVYGARFV